MITGFDTTFGDRLKRLREHLRFSQQEMADKLGISQISLSNYERGKRFPDVRIIQALLELFNVNLVWLFTGNGAVFETVMNENPEYRELFYWFYKLPIVRFAYASALEEIKHKFPHLFENPVDFGRSAGAGSAAQKEPEQKRKRGRKKRNEVKYEKDSF
jgi:transcriptional regulator with XRE-family HTH domain